MNNIVRLYLRQNVIRIINSINILKKIIIPTNLFLLFSFFYIFLISYSSPMIASTTKKAPMSLQNIMKFKAINSSPTISTKGDWVIYCTKPGIGNGMGHAYHIPTKKSFKIPRGFKPVITKNSKWIVMAIHPDTLENEKADGNKKQKNSMAIFETATGNITKINNIKSYIFSNNSKWLIYQPFPEEKKEKNTDLKKKKKKKKNNIKTFSIVLRHLVDGKETTINNVSKYSLDPASRFIAYVIYNKKTKENKNALRSSGLYYINLNKTNIEKKIYKSQDSQYYKLIWSKNKSKLAFILQNKNNIKPTTSLLIWNGPENKLQQVVSADTKPEGWILPKENKLTWSEDENRLFFGFKPEDEFHFTHPEKNKKEDKKKLTPDSLFNLSRLQKKKSVDIWHWQDPLINTNQKKQWKQLKKRTYTAVYFIKKKKYIQLANRRINRIITTENSDIALGFDNSLYKKETTWDGQYSDVYIINMKNGKKKKILSHFNRRAYLSNKGKFLLYYNNKHWYIYDIKKNQTNSLTKKINTPFYNEDHDYPSAVPSYRFAGWTEKDRSVIIYDKYDIWQFYTSGRTICLTNGRGRKNNISFRINKLDKKSKYFKTNEKLLLSGYSHKKKNQVFFSASIGKAGVKRLIKGNENKWFQFYAKAKNTDQILYTRENFQEFPDLWINDLEFKNPQKISDVNPQKKNFLWGKGEIVEWDSIDGTKLQGALFKPDNFDPDKRYPVLVYYYRFSSQRVHRFNQVVINHRPCFPYYTGHDYLVFLPDIRFDIGRPGYSALKCLVPGVQKLISMGIADPKAIGLHGHSWSGYQTAHVITMTKIFACAIAGAPVSNMTSAYSGIRWGSGRARQFQYEKSQSRIGRSLIEAPHLYIENSPIFYADRINTPLLIQSGDKDGAVPWYQSIELYLIMRRLNKNCIFLQYNDEPHHLKKYSNKLNYTIRFKEYLDHYLKGKPAPDWIKKGIPYRKK